MNTDSFNLLIELQSHQKKINEFIETINEENKRIKFVEANIQRSLEEIELKNKSFIEKQQNSGELEKEVTVLQDQILRTNKNITNAQSQNEIKACEKELLILKPKLERLEQELLYTWEEIEIIEDEINESKNFEMGAKKSLKKIIDEVESNNKDSNLAIDDLKERKREIFMVLGDNISKIFEQLESRKSPAVVFLDDKNCSACMTQIDQSLIAEINAMRDLSFCPTCGRILVSLNLRY